MNVRLLLFAAATVVAASLPLGAQSVATAFPAREGYSAAAQLNSEFSQVVFKGVGTASYDAGLVRAGLDLGTGKSEVWAYLFTAKTGSGADTTLLRLMTKSFGFIIPVPLSVPFSIPDTLLFSPPMPDTWMNSTDLVARLQTNATFQDYRAKNPDSLAQSVALFNTPMGEPMWMVNLAGEGYPSLTCFVNSANGDVQCAGIPSSVRDIIASSAAVVRSYPTPAQDVVVVEVDPAYFSPEAVLTLFGTDGAAVREFGGAFSDSGRYTLALGGLADGLYFLRYTTPAAVLALPVLISR